MARGGTHTLCLKLDHYAPVQRVSMYFSSLQGMGGAAPLGVLVTLIPTGILDNLLG